MTNSIMFWKVLRIYTDLCHTIFFHLTETKERKRRKLYTTPTESPQPNKPTDYTVKHPTIWIVGCGEENQETHE